MTTPHPQDKIIEALEDMEDKQLANYIRAEIDFLIAELCLAIEERDKIQKKFDELKVILRET